jgi:F0F1-type ATP synthase membrane subunit b/b'
MRRAATFALLLCLTAGLSFAAGAEGGEGDGNLLMWKWANFLVLAGGLGYLMAKTLPGLFAERSQSIVKDMTDSEKIRKDAEARAAEVDRRLAGLEAEIAALRTDSKKESEAETERLARHTAAEIAKIRAHSEQEIVAAGKAARLDLKRYAAELAVDLAEKKIRARMTPAIEDGLVRGFVRDLK